MGLKVHSRLYVLTPEGEREIQLCIGDITHLPQQDKVDIILVSAFPNDYAPMQTSVIGALKINLGISVQRLAYYHKKEDHRKQLGCWISHPLPHDVPYRQLVCLEKKPKNILREGSSYSDKKISVLASIQDLFRALMPAFNNANKSVITPLLGTGFQHIVRSDMMNTLVKEAISWMRMGMPLQLLKIVIYARNENQVSERDQAAVQAFETWKLKMDKMKKPMQFKEPALLYDILVVYSGNDEDVVETMKKFTKKSTKLVNIKDVIKKEDSGSFELYNAMLESARVVPILSEHYLQDILCIDAYNLALCARRRVIRHVLAPLCMQRLTLPHYMAMVQWINCKDYDDEKIKAACTTLVQEVKAEQSGQKKTKAQYDIFISYSHQNLATAKLVLETIKSSAPQLKVFFDYEALKTGVAWQQTLYHALEESRCVLTLLSTQYWASPVCNEEFNIALAKHLAKNKDIELVSVMLDDCPVPPGDITAHPYDSLTDVVHDVCDWLITGQRNNALSTVPEPVDPLEIGELYRQKALTDHYIVENGHITSMQQVHSVKQDPFVFMSYTIRDDMYAQCIKYLLKSMYPDIRFNSKLGKETGVMQAEDADCYVVILSSVYVSSHKELDEYNFLLSKQRSHPDRKLLYVIQVEEMVLLPTYMQLVSMDTALSDDMWRESSVGKESNAVIVECRDKLKKEHGMAITNAQLSPLTKACSDIHHLITTGSYASMTQAQKGVLNNVCQILDSVTEKHVVTFTTDNPQMQRQVHGRQEEGGIVPHGDTKEDIVPHGDSNGDNISYGDSNGDNVPHGDSNGDNVPHGDSNGDNVSQGDSNGDKVPHGDSNGDNVPHGDGNQKNFPCRDTKEDNVPQSDKKVDNVPQSDKKVDNVPQSDKKVDNVPQSDKKVDNVPQSDKKVDNVPQSDKKVDNVPNSSKAKKSRTCILL